MHKNIVFYAFILLVCATPLCGVAQTVTSIVSNFTSTDTIIKYIANPSLNAFEFKCIWNDSANCHMYIDGGMSGSNCGHVAQPTFRLGLNTSHSYSYAFLNGYQSILGFNFGLGLSDIGQIKKVSNVSAWWNYAYTDTNLYWVGSMKFLVKSGNQSKSNCWYDSTEFDLYRLLHDFSPIPNDTINVRSNSFQFVSGGTFFDMEYVFASDEFDTLMPEHTSDIYPNPWITYPSSAERICSLANDGIGVFISGPGINGPFSNKSENIAVVPGTNMPVGIRSIHPQLDIGDSCGLPVNPQFYISNNDTNTPFPFNGYTTPLQLKKIPINPCDTYTVTLALGDVGVKDDPPTPGIGKISPFGGDGASAMIIKQHSARTGFWYPAPLKLYDGLGKDTIAEGCPGMLLKLVRFTNINQPDSIHLVYEGDAQYGVDYDSLPEWVYFTPGQDTTSFVITPTEDFSVEAIENLVIRLMPPGEFPCPVDTTEVEFWISDRPPLTASIPDTFFFNPCETDSIAIGPDSISGLEDFTFQWSSGATSRNDTVAPVNNQNYTLTIYDACMYDSIVVTTVLRQAPDPDFALINNDTTISCNDSLVPIGFEVTDNFYPQFHYLWNTSDTDSIAWVNPLVNGTHNYTVTVYRPCMPDSFLLNLTVNVENDPVIVDIDDIDPTHCPGHPYNLSPAVSGGYPPYTFVWSTTQTTSDINVAPFVTTEYILSVTDSCALDTVAEPVTVNVPVFDSLEIIGKRQITFPCDVGYLNIAAGDYRGRGGTGASGADQSHYTFSWNNWLSTQKSLKLDVFADTTLTLQMTDTCMLDTAVLHIPVDVFDGPFLSASLPDTLHACIGEAFSFGPEVKNGVKPYAFEWQNGSADSLFSYTPELAKRAFAVTVSDYCGYSEQEKVTVYATRPIADFRAVNDSYEPRIIQFENESDGAISYRWFFGDGAESTEEQPVYSYQDLKEWEVTLIATDTFGCDDELTKALDIPLNLFIPNAFTPDGDGNNEVWQPLGYGFKTLVYTIFDRWGNAIFEVKETSSAIRPWDGTASGTPVPVGTYTYRIIVDPYKGLKEEIMGEVTVVR